MPYGWTRYRNQEGEGVKRWFARGKGIISVVNGYFPNETNIRFSTKRGGKKPIGEIRGHSSILDKRSDADLIRRVLRIRNRY